MKLFLILNLLVSFSVFSLEVESGPCKVDKEKFCKDVKGRKEVAECMKQHKDELSAECKAKIVERRKQAKEKIKVMKDSCEADKEKYCKDVKAGKGAIIKCLRQNETSLSAECKATLPKKKGKK